MSVGSPSEAANVAKQLDMILAPLSRQLRYPLPVPAHLLGDGDGSGTLGLASLSDTRQQQSLSPLRSQRAADPSAEERERDGDEESAGLQLAIKEQSRLDCAARVCGLAAWQDRVEEGLARGLDSQNILEHVLDGVASMRAITRSVQDQSNNLSHSASLLMSRKVRLVQIQEELQRAIQHFTHIEDLCREADDGMLTAASPRFPNLFQELEAEMQFLCKNAQFKSAKVYATKLAVAQQKTAAKLMNAIKASFSAALKETRAVSKSDAGLHPAPASTSQPAIEAGPASALVSSSLRVADGVVDTANGPWDLTRTPPTVTAALMGAGLGLVDLANPTESFARTLEYLNAVFARRLAGQASLRRMAELRCSFSYTGAEAFGEEPLGSIEDDPMVQDLLRYYVEARAGLVGPLLRNWLTVWCRADAQQQQREARSSLSVSLALPPSSPAGSTGEQSPHTRGASVSATTPPEGGGGSLEQSNGGLGDSTPAFAATGALAVLAAAVGSSATQLPQLAEHICSLLEICLGAEKQVLDAVWVRGDFVNYVFPKLVSGLADELYHAFRSHLVRVDDLVELAQTVEHIQRVNLRQSSDDGVVQELSRLWVRMIQDVQERMIFRTSVCLRVDVGRGHPTRQLVAQYTDVITAGAQLAEVPVVAGVRSAVRLLSLLYHTLEFSVFSVFAEEAVKTSLQLIKELGGMLAGQAAIAPWAEVVSYGAQLMHLLYLRHELTRIDANITVVEKSLDLSKLARQRTFEIVQSSRESKTLVESEVQTCSTRLSQAVGQVVAAPLTGAARKSAAQVQAGLQDMVGLAAKGKYLMSLLVGGQHQQTQVALCQAVDRRVAELTSEVAEMHLQSCEASSATATSPDRQQQQPAETGAAPARGESQSAAKDKSVSV